MPLSVWYRDLTSQQTGPIPKVRAWLRDEVQETPRAACGIALIDRPHDDGVRQLRSWSRAARVLALLPPDAQLSPQGKWALLAAGAADVIEWPDGRSAARAILARLARWTEIEGLVADKRVHDLVVGGSDAWRTLLRQLVEITVFSDAAILLSGDTGTGKEQLARLVHELDPRPRKGDLVVVDCTTLSRDLMGSELFGHERGAYTGAAVERDGAIALAHRGTLFLDEIGELDPLLQAQLLRVVQERSYKRVGSNAWRTSEFRLVCATNRDLLQEVHAGRFRGDLYYRIADRSLRLPSLDERRDDIMALAKHFWRSGAADDSAPEFDSALEQFLITRSYPGNVRDLRRIVRVLRIRHAGIGAVTLGALPEAEHPAVSVLGDGDHAADEPLNAPAFVRAIETAIERGIGLKEIGRLAAETAIRVALAREDGNLQRAARRLGVTDRALQIRRANGRPLPFDS